MNDIVVLFSGGTDSTCSAALSAEKYDTVRLLTFKRFGIFSISNATYNIAALTKKYGSEKFTHEFISIDKMFKYVSYNQYFHYVKKYGFMVLATCGLCKLAMHTRVISYCLEHNVKIVADGANRHAGVGQFPAQMPETINLFREMYACFDIDYQTPVYEQAKPRGLEWDDKLCVPCVGCEKDIETSHHPMQTSGDLLYKRDIMSVPNVKGTKVDRQMQGRCFQLVLFNICVLWYYFDRYGKDHYVATVKKFMSAKISDATDLIRQYQKDGQSNRIKKYFV